MAAKHILGRIRKRRPAVKRLRRKPTVVKIKVKGTPAQVHKAMKKFVTPENGQPALEE